MASHYSHLLPVDQRGLPDSMDSLASYFAEPLSLPLVAAFLRLVLLTLVLSLVATFLRLVLLRKRPAGAANFVSSPLYFEAANANP